MRRDSHNHDRSNRHRNHLTRAAGAISLLALATWAFIQPIVLLAVGAAVGIAALLVVVPFAVIRIVAVLDDRLGAIRAWIGERLAHRTNVATHDATEGFGDE